MSTSRKPNLAMSEGPNNPTVIPAPADHAEAQFPATISTTAPAPAAPEHRAPELITPKALRTGSKAASLLEMLTRSEGASLDEMMERTGWLSHTVRAAMTGLRKKGHAIDKRVSGTMTVWFISA